MFEWTLIRFDRRVVAITNYGRENNPKQEKLKA